MENLSPQDIYVDKDKKVISISSNSGKVNLENTNYTGFWFALLTEDGDNIADVYHHWQGNWFDLTIHDNIMTCTFSEVDLEQPEEVLDVPVTAGDIFYDFQLSVLTLNKKLNDMNKLMTAILIFIVCLLTVACSDDKELEIYPIRFGQQGYSIFLGVGASFSYVDGGGVYELAANDSEVLGTFGIGVETHRLMINPAKTGESTLTITDVRTNSKVELHIRG